MANETLIRTLAIVAAFAAVTIRRAATGGGRRRAHAGDLRVGSEFGSRPIALGIGKAVIIDLPRDAKDVLVADPLIANAVVRSARRAYMIGVKVGQTSIFFFDAEGRQIAGFDIAVKRDLNGIRDAIRQVLPTSDIRVEALGADGVVLSGTVATPVEAQTAFSIAGRLVNQGTAALAAFRRQAGKRDHRARPRPGQSAGHRGGGAARCDQADRRGSERHRRHRLGSAPFQQRESVPGLRNSAGGGQHGSPARSRRMAAPSTRRCARWSAPA